MKRIENQIAEALGVELDECLEYEWETIQYSLKGTTNILEIVRGLGEVRIITKENDVVTERKIKITLE